MKDQGFIIIWRKILENSFCKDNSEKLGFWIILLLSASHKPNDFFLGQQKISLNRGQFLTGRKKLSQITNVSETQCERYLTCLENEQQIGQQKTSKYRIITIHKYNNYQKLDKSLDSRRTADGQQTDTINQCNQ